MVSMLKRMQARMTSDLFRSISKETFPTRSASCSGHMNVTLASFPLISSLMLLNLCEAGVKMFALAVVCAAGFRAPAGQGTKRLPGALPRSRVLLPRSARCRATNSRARWRRWSAPRCRACAPGRAGSPSGRLGCWAVCFFLSWCVG